MLDCCLCLHLAPSRPPSNITATVLTSTSILILWEPPLEQYRNGPILAYNLTVEDGVTGVQLHSSILTATSFVLDELQPYTLYNVSLSARTSVGYGPFETQSVTTLEDCKMHKLIALS